LKKSIYKDDKDRPLFIISGDRIVFARYPNLAENTREVMLDVCKDFYESGMSEKSPDQLKRFLDYEDEIVEFCS
jgi:hypothetical protein